MRIAVSICVAFLNIGTATAMPIDMTVERLFSVCEAPTVRAATERGSELGWQRQTDAETEEWRTHFVAYNGGSLEIVGWRRKMQTKPSCCRFGSPSVQMGTKRVPMPRQDLPDCWTPCRRGLVRPTIFRRMPR